MQKLEQAYFGNELCSIVLKKEVEGSSEADKQG
jgi:hypothetical protein